MERIAQVHSPPEKPLVIFDGDCRFCRMWIRRWMQMTGEGVDYLPFQNEDIPRRFPEIPHTQFETAVQLIEPDGRVFSAAEGVFRTQAHNPRLRWTLWLYQNFPGFAHVTEAAYHFIARHRTLALHVTRIAWGNHAEKPTHEISRWLFLRWLAIIFFIAFASLSMQLDGLIGHNGITPASELMQSASTAFSAGQLDRSKFLSLPTLCWLNTSDQFLHLQCVAGMALSILLMFGIAPAVCLFLLWLLYLSLTSVSGEFLSFQWDALLLETGFLAIFLAPWKWLPRFNKSPAPTLALWFLRWLLFRLMFGSGCVKLLSHDATWRNLTALHYHFETQPLPTVLGWLAHQSPPGLLKASVVIMFAIQLVVPFFLFLPRRFRMFAAASFAFLELLIFATGNYCFFNLLTFGLCGLLFDDFAVLRLFSPSWRTRLAQRFGIENDGFKPNRRPDENEPPPKNEQRLSSSDRFRNAVLIPFTLLVLLISGIQLTAMFKSNPTFPRPLLALYAIAQPFGTINSYGLFPVMTTTRPEIIIEGSNDGVHWKAYEFKYKPGDLARRPPFVAPHQPRLDWQMWFAALGSVQENQWFIHFCWRLLQGSPEVLHLLKENPFPNSPPRYIRAITYDYHFTDFAALRKSGHWWRRTETGTYLPPISLADFKSTERSAH